MCNLQQEPRTTKSDKPSPGPEPSRFFFSGQKASMKKNRRLLVSIPRYFITALLRPRPPSRGADAGLLLLYVGTTVRIRYTIPVPRNAACGVREPAVKAPGGRAARHRSIGVLPFDAQSRAGSGRST